MITRRVFLAGAGSLACGALSVGCSRPKPTRAGVLEALVNEVVVPELNALVPASTGLEAALGGAASPAGLERARAAQRRAQLAWQRAYAFRSGPAVDSGAFLRAQFWPVRSAALDQVLNGTAPIDVALVESLGVDAKGLYALEALLFGAQPLGARGLAFAQALARDVAQRARRVAQLLGDGRGFAREFGAGGQDSVSKLVNQQVETVEGIAVDRLLRALGLLDRQRLAARELPGGPSGLSTQLPLNLLEVSHSLYSSARGGGLNVLVEQTNPPAAQRLKRAFDEALAALGAVDGPLEQVAARERARVQAAADKVKALEVALKTDLTGALAVSLSIAAGDGD